MQAENQGFYDVVSRVGSEVITREQSQRFQAATAGPLQRAQAAGVVRRDLAAADVLQVFRMVGATTREFSGGRTVQYWPRYLQLLLDAMRPAAASPLPPRP
jgi:hypothetical protein